jgi:ribulose 1,5-bisphosphate synthetase/thiazole synthase
LKRHNKKCGKDERAVQIDPELLTITYIEMLEEANVDCLLYTNVFDVIMRNNCVTGVIVCNKNGLYNAI